MGKVVEFPTKAAAAQTLKHALHGKIEKLDKLYDDLDALHSQLHNLEKECIKLEYDFDCALGKYANVVGVENIEIEFLGYTSRHMVTIDPEDASLKIIIDEELPFED